MSPIAVARREVSSPAGPSPLNYAFLAIMSRTGQISSPEARFWNVDSRSAFQWLGLFHSDACRAYRHGEIDAQKLMRLTCNFADLLPVPEGLELIAWTGQLVAVSSPKSLNRSRPPIPRFVRECAVALMGIVERAFPNWRLKPLPNRELDSIAAIVRIALDGFGFTSPRNITERTLYRWYREDQPNQRRRGGRRRQPR